MWVSNTATVMMLIAAVLAIVKQKDIYHENSRKGSATALLIGLSFSATIGGMATPVGTPPNMIFMGMYEKAFPENPPIDFLQWMTIGLPFSFLMLVASYFIIKMMFIPTQVNHKFDMEIILNRYKTLGRMKREEKIISIIFMLTVILWFFRENLNLGVVHLKGWSHIFGVYSSYIKDSTVVIFTSFFLFLIPSKHKTPLLDWNCLLYTSRCV